MTYVVRLDGSVECETPEEAIALARATGRVLGEKQARPIPARDTFERILRGICDKIPEGQDSRRGPKGIAIGDVLYAAALKVYKRLPAREVPQGGPHYNTVLLHMNKPSFEDAIVAAMKLAVAHLDGRPRSRRSWGDLTAKTPTARRNELRLRDLCEIVQALAT